MSLKKLNGEVDIKSNIQTLVFDFEESPKGPNKLPKSARKIFLSFCASLTCLPFGIMLGWPSPTYPKLLSPNSTLPITTDQSAMIAGFLMIGNIFGTPLSNLKILGDNKSFILGPFLMALGWTAMIFAKNIFWLLGSRFLIGLGNGYSFPYVIKYIEKIDEEQSNLEKFLTKLPNIVMCFGVFVAFALGNYVTLKRFSIISALITIIISVILFFLPRIKNYNRRVVIHNIKQLKNLVPSKENLSFYGVMRNKVLRKRFIILSLLTFFQQFSGVPATIVYSQIIFTALNCYSPEIFAILYSILFLFSHVFVYFSNVSFNKKSVLLLSSGFITILLLCQILLLYYNFYFNLLNVAILFLYVFVHTLGMAIYPSLFIQTFFPENARKVITQFYIMFFSALAIIITKIFQVFLDKYSLYVPFSLFFTVSLTCFVFSFVFVPRNEPNDID